MKTFVLLLTLLAPLSGFAASFTLTDNSTGRTFQCGEGDGNGGGGIDASCIPTVASFCNRNTGNSSTTCFNKASEFCRGAPRGAGDCVVSTADFCNRNTGNSSTTCFNMALETCKGNVQAIQSLMQDALKKDLN